MLGLIFLLSAAVQGAGLYYFPVETALLNIVALVFLGGCARKAPLMSEGWDG